MKENKKKNLDGTKGKEHGEFVTSYFEWLPIDEQKKQAEKLQEITKEK